MGFGRCGHPHRGKVLVGHRQLEQEECRGQEFPILLQLETQAPWGSVDLRGEDCSDVLLSAWEETALLVSAQ